MSRMPRTVRLAGEELSEHRHLCALVDGPEEAYTTLLPFIIEGLEQGDRAFHLVDPELRDEHVRLLAANGIDVPAAMESHQLEVRTWTDSYLRGGRFDGAAQLAYVTQLLGEGRALGFPRTRLIGSMEWAVDPGFDLDLLDYESRVDEILGTLPDVAICTYDVNHHRARTIAKVLDVHKVALVGGVLRANRSPARRSPRDRLLASASRLFSETGTQATGVDALIAEAGVAKATFYRHYPSKNDLIVAWLRDPRTRWFDRVREQAEAQGGDATEFVTRLFEGIADWLEFGDYRGCPYLNTSVEIADPTHPARRVVAHYLQEIEDYLVGRLAASGYRNPGALGAELFALAAGSISLARARRSRAGPLTAGTAAVRLLRSAERD